MGPDLIIGVLAAFLFSSLLLNLVQHFMLRGVARSSARAITDANDRAHAAELRAADQIDAMLDRLKTAPRLDLITGRPDLPPLSQDPEITDEPFDDENWNNFVHEPRERDAE